MTHSSALRIGIAGYGNLGRGVQAALTQQPDMTLAAIFTRRDPQSIVQHAPAVPVYPLAEATSHRDAIDVMILCGGSKDDLPHQGPELARWFCTVDSFDTHPRIPAYFESVDAGARAGDTLAIISIGWDPGLFSLNRLIGEAVLPDGATYTFWGKGLSQGHSDAIRHVPGVRQGVQYTVPNPQAMARVRSGERPTLSAREKHTRECFVVLEPDADAEAVRQQIITMPDYFADYDTTVHVISEAEMAREHAGMPHGGFVIRSGQARDGAHQSVEFSLKLESNPQFTASVLVAYARAAHRLYQAGERGARTLFDIAPGLLSPKSPATLRQELL